MNKMYNAKARYEDPEYAQRMRDIGQSDEVRQKISNSAKERYANPVYKAKHKAAVNTPEARANKSAAMKEMWRKRKEAKLGL